MIYILIIAYLFYQLADAFGDVAIEKGKQGEWHLWGAIAAELFIITLSYSIYSLTWNTLICIAILTISRKIVFDVLHNLRKGNHWYYQGKIDWTDKLMRKIFFFVNFDK